MATSLFPFVLVPALQNNGTFAAGAKLAFYLSGTTTLATVYDADGDPISQAANAFGTVGVEADAFGRFPGIYLDDSITYRSILRTAAGVQVGDDIDPATSIGGSFIGNITSFDLSRAALTGSSYSNSPNWIPHFDAGVGNAVTDKHFHYQRLNMALPVSGSSWIGLAVSANIGGTTLNTVPELISSYAVYDTASPNCTNPNIVPIQGRTIVTADGTVSGGALISTFGMAGYCGGSPTGHDFNQCGIEVDVGSNYAATTSGFGATRDARIGGRSGVTITSMGLQKGDVNNDAAIVIASGPQYAGGYQAAYPNCAGWRYGIMFTNAFAAAGFGEPIAIDGSLMCTVGSYTIGNGIDISSVSISGSVFKSATMNFATNAATFFAASHGLEIGSTGGANIPHIDFHSSGNVIDYDSRIYATNGTAVVGKGTMVIEADASIFVGSFIRNGAANTGTVGTSAFPWAGGYTQTAFTVTSDARLKTQVEELDARWITFLKALRPVSYQFIPESSPAVTATRTVKRQKTKSVEAWEYVASEIDGVMASRKTLVTKEVGVTELIPVLDENGEPEMVMANVDNALGDDGRPIMVPVPNTMAVPVMEEVEEEYEVAPAMDQSYARLHLGFIAQEVRQALSDSGLEDDPDMTKTVWALFVYDQAADRYSLRYEEFVALLARGFQALEARISALEGA